MKQDLQTSVTKKRYVEVLPYGVLEARTALLSLERGDLLGFAFYKPWITGGAIDGESPSHIVAQDMAERRTATQSQDPRLIISKVALMPVRIVLLHASHVFW